ncbi:MAG: Extracellular ligand-binding receptor [Candidatus Taylorbacteria bacterium]|nr:Extracellular ligand-binding receptor [Candidatus Taylorbacteria bacterium]
MLDMNKCNYRSAVIASSIVLFVILIAVLSKHPSSGSSRGKEPIRIGLAIGLTGYAANWGSGEQKAVELALDEYSAKLDVPIKLVVEDTKSDGIGTVNAIQKLVEVDHVQAIIGPTWGDSFQGGLPIAEKAKVAMISPSAAMEAIENRGSFGYFFSTWWPQQQEVSALASRITKDHAKTVYIIHDQDSFNLKFSDMFQDAIASADPGIRIQRVTAPISANDFRTYVTKIKDAKPDAIFALFQDTGSVGSLMKQLKEQGVVAKVYSSTSAQNEGNLKKFPGYFDGLRYSYPSYEDDSRYAALKRKFIEKYGSGADEGPAFVNAYNASVVLLESIKAGARTGEEIRKALGKIRMPGVGVEELSFDMNNQIGNVTYLIKTVKGNSFVRLD